MSIWIATALLAPLLALQAPSYEFSVRHDHDPWGACQGTLTVDDQGIRYASQGKPEHDRVWTWLQIQSVDRKSGARLSVLTYEDLKWRLGQDRPYDFSLAPLAESKDRGGETEAGGDMPSKDDSKRRGSLEGAFRLISAHLGKPLTDRVARSIEPEFEVAAKHLHTFGGCQGVLRIGPEWIVYETSRPGHTRSWKRGRDVDSVWSADRFHFEIRAFEHGSQDFSSMTTFRFQLKEPLDQDFYDRLRREMIPNW